MQAQTMDHEAERAERICPLCRHRNGTKLRGEPDAFIRHACAQCVEPRGACAAAEGARSKSSDVDVRTKRFRGQPIRVGSRSGGRVMLSVAILPEVRQALHARAAAAGVSIAEYVANAIAEPGRIFATEPAAIAKPLSDLSYRLSQIKHATDRNDSDALHLHLNASIEIVSKALLPLGREHMESVHERDERLAGGWHG